MWSILEDGRPLLPMSVARLLPCEVTDALSSISEAVDEICLRADRQAFAVSVGRNIALNAVLTGAALSEIFLAACGGSLYAHTETVREGYLTLHDGVRVGVIGHAVVDSGKMVGVRDISSLCFRIPGAVTVDPTPLTDILRGFSEPRGLLLFSPPGGGKTTALRSLIRALASGENPRRVAVVDTRRELGPCLGSAHLCVDVLSGYPRRQGIEIAARSMDAEIIVCDEICGREEAETVLSLQGGGAILIATAHAASLPVLLSRPDLALLHKAKTFGAYVAVDRMRTPPFDICLYEDTEALA